MSSGEVAETAAKARSRSAGFILRRRAAAGCSDFVGSLYSWQGTFLVHLSPALDHAEYTGANQLHRSLQPNVVGALSL